MRWIRRGKIFDPTDHVLLGGRREFAQSPQALVLADRVQLAKRGNGRRNVARPHATFGKDSRKRRAGYKLKLETRRRAGQQLREEAAESWRARRELAVEEELAIEVAARARLDDHAARVYAHLVHGV
jgi:hypothetical protein